MLHPDVVVLVPGFMGFRIFGKFSYFDPEAGTTAASELRERLGRPVSDVRVGTVPTGPLKSRIQYLASHLNDLVGQGAERFYLVGHSTGGVDVQLLMTQRPFWDGAWTDRERAMQARVQSIVTISAPHYGTGILDSSALQFLAHPVRGPQGALSLSRVLASLPRTAFRDLRLIFSALDLKALQLPDLLTWLKSIATHRQLLEELTPAHMAAIRGTVEPLDRPLACFVSGADVQTTGTRQSDPLYAAIHSLARTQTAPPVPEVTAAMTKLRETPDSLWIRNTASAKLHIDVGASDGVVNSARQWLAGTTLGGIVVGDHCDVIGDYDQLDESSRRRSNTGLFQSGAGFGDGQFTELWRQVGARLADAVEARPATLRNPGGGQATKPGGRKGTASAA